VPLGATLAVPWRLGLACAPEWSLKAELIWDKGTGRHTNSKSPARAHETVLMLARDPRRPASGQSIIRVRPDGSGTTHPAPFPPELAVRLLDMAAPIRGPVLDPFCGCGATGVACAERGLDFVGVDLKPSYIEEARRRLSAPRP
jgi:tRNA G10  N-methylase Trm11